MPSPIPSIAVPRDVNHHKATEVGADHIFRLDLDSTRHLLHQMSDGLPAVLDEVVARLRRDTVVLLTEAPVHADDALMAMCHYVGALVPAIERPIAYLDHVTPGRADFEDGKEAPLSQQRNSLMPHTDQSARSNPPDYLALACVQNDTENSGESILVPIEPIAQHLRDSAPRAYDLLQDAVYPIFNVPKNDWASTGPLLRLRRGKSHDGKEIEYHEVRFRDRGVRAGFQTMTTPPSPYVESFEMLSQHIHDENRWIVHKLLPGEMVFFDNARVLHGRKAIAGHAERDLKRLNGNYWPAHAPVIRTERRLVAGIR